jgi:hypothetical protein
MVFVWEISCVIEENKKREERPIPERSNDALVSGTASFDQRS